MPLLFILQKYKKMQNILRVKWWNKILDVHTTSTLPVKFAF